MTKLVLAIVALAMSVSITMPPSVVSAQMGTWPGWTCPSWVVQNMPVSAGSLSGRACSRVYQSINTLDNDWQVWAETYVSVSVVQIYTRVEGHDRCGTADYQPQMGGEHIDYNMSHGTSLIYQGKYQRNCSAHIYRTTSWHYNMLYNTSTWEGTWGYTYY